MSMTVSHSFTGEDIEDGGDKKADTEHHHHDIKHVSSSTGVLQILEILHSAPANVRGAILIQLESTSATPGTIATAHACSRLGRALFGPESGNCRRIKCTDGH